MNEKNVIQISVQGFPNTGKSIIVSKIHKMLSDLDIESTEHYLDGFPRTNQEESKIVDVIKVKTKVEIYEGQIRRDNNGWDL